MGEGLCVGYIYILFFILLRGYSRILRVVAQFSKHNMNSHMTHSCDVAYLIQENNCAYRHGHRLFVISGWTPSFKESIVT